MLKRVYFCLACILILAACSTPPVADSPLTINEYRLSAQPDISTDQLVFHFAEGDQQAILAKTSAYRDFAAQYLAYNRSVLEPFGYSLRQSGGSTSLDPYKPIDILQGDKPVVQGVVMLHPASLNASDTNFVAVADMPDGTYTLTRQGMQKRNAPANQEPYGYIADRLLSAQITGNVEDSQVTVYFDGQPVYNTKFNNVSTYAPFEGPFIFGNHWALAVLDAKPDGKQGWNPYNRVIIDGLDVNVDKGYQQAFQFSVLGGKPLFFYEKGGKIGISFDGQQLAQGYDEVPHYGCCSGSLLNPRTSMNAVWFFARRGGNWYYVEAYVPTQP